MISDLITWLHIAAGMLALVTGLLSMSVKKGGRIHKRSGMIYFICMIIIFATAVPMSLWKSNIFLLLIAIFSVYLTYTGYRSLKMKNPKRDGGAKWFDWLITSIALACGIAMIAYAAIGISKGALAFSTILAVFGGITLAISITDMRHYNKLKRGEQQKMGWFFFHIGRMVGAYIATTTAFVTNNFQELPILMQWLGPTLIGTIAITIWTRKYRRKFSA